MRSIFAEPRKGEDARSILGEYRTLFENTAELNILRILGLFNRPADPTALRLLRQSVPIKGLTDEIVTLSSDGWAAALENLKDARLIEYADADGVLECHPLVREYLAEELRDSHRDGMLEAQGRLFDHY